MQGRFLKEWFPVLLKMFWGMWYKFELEYWWTNELYSRVASVEF